jgi:hypothetical protein
MPVAMVFKSFTIQCFSPIQPDDPNKRDAESAELPALLLLSLLPNKHAPLLATVSGRRDPKSNWKRHVR